MKKFAVLIGINYTGTSSALNGCINDANHLKTFLIEKAGYLPENIMMLADDNINVKPTKQNIINSFATLVSKATNEQFTELWFSYSGHGSYVTDLNGDENDRRDEVLCPLDYSTAGMIDDDFIYTNLVAKLPSTATLFALSDSCHSGTVFDLPYLYTTTLTTNNIKNTHVANVISISGCRDDQTSADAYIAGRYEGAMTWSFLNALSNVNYNVKLGDLLAKMRTLLLNNYSQVPQLALSKTSDLDRYFIQPNTIVPTTTSTPAPAPTPITKIIKFNIKVDYWYKESTWNVWSVADNKYIFDKDNVFTYKYQTSTISKVLPVGTYKLCIKDSYGDGGVTSKVTCGLITLVAGNMTSGKLAEYTFSF
jgi:hypothetical protein